MKRRRKRRRKKIMIGEKIMVVAFMLVFIMGSALDGSEWEIPLAGVMIGIVLLEVGRIIARMEGSEYV